MLACAAIAMIGRAAAGTWGHPGVIFPVAWTVFLAVPAFLVPNLVEGRYAALVITGFAAASVVSTRIRARPGESPGRTPSIAAPVRVLVIVGGLAGVVASIVVQRAHGYSLGSITSLRAVSEAARSITVDRYSGAEGIPSLAVFLLSLTFAGALAAPFVTVNFRGLKSLLYLSWPTFGAAAYAVATTARAAFLIAFVLSASGVLALATLRSTREGKLTLRTGAGLVLGALMVGATFVWIAFSRIGTGPSAATGAVAEKVGVYAGGSLPALNTWLHSGVPPPQFGLSSFQGALKYIFGDGQVGSSAAYDVFVPVTGDGARATNVYSALRQLIEDFTVPGAALVILAATVLTAEMYRRARTRGSVGCLVGVIAWGAWVIFSQTVSLFQFTNVCVGVLIGGAVLVRYATLELVENPSTLAVRDEGGLVDERAPLYARPHRLRSVTPRRSTNPNAAPRALLIASPTAGISQTIRKREPLGPDTTSLHVSGLLPTPTGGQPDEPLARGDGHDPHGTRGLNRNMLVYWVAKAIPGVIYLAATIVMVRVGGKSSYGVYTLTWTSATLAANLAVGWQCQASLRFTAKKAISSNLLLGRRSVSSLVAGSIVAAVIVFPFVQDRDVVDVISLLVGAVLLTAASAAQSLLLAVHQANLKANYVLFGEVIRAGASLVLPLVLLISMPGLSAQALIYGMAGAQLLSLVALAFWNRSANWVPDPDELKQWWIFGWPIGLWLAGGTALQFSDRFFIQYFYGSGETGTYGAVYDLITRLMVFAVFPITMATHPVISRLWNNGERLSAIRLNRKALVLQLSLAVPVVLLVVGLRSIWMPLLLDERGRDLELVFPLAVGAVTWQLALTVHKKLEMTNNTRLMLVYLLIALVVNSLLNYFLLPPYGPVASAWATVIASLIYFALCWSKRLPEWNSKNHMSGV